jgi:hypothetical protein
VRRHCISTGETLHSLMRGYLAARQKTASTVGNFASPTGSYASSVGYYIVLLPENPDTVRDQDV